MHQHSGKSSETILDQEAILRHLNIRPGFCILDAGCGDGYMAKAFAQQSGKTGKVYAIDLHAPSIEKLIRETAGSNITAVLGDITQATLLDSGSIDLIYLSTVMHGFTPFQVVNFMSEANRILKPGGRLCVVEIKKGETPFGPPQDIRYSPEELIQAVGMRPEKTVWIGDYFYMQMFVS